MPMTQREMIKLLEKNSFKIYKSEGKGSHIKMKRDGLSIVVPKGELKKGTERQILKLAGLI